MSKKGENVHLIISFYKELDKLYSKRAKDIDERVAYKIAIYNKLKKEYAKLHDYLKIVENELHALFDKQSS